MASKIKTVIKNVFWHTCWSTRWRISWSIVGFALGDLFEELVGKLVGGCDIYTWYTTWKICWYISRIWHNFSFSFSFEVTFYVKILLTHLHLCNLCPFSLSNIWLKLHKICIQIIILVVYNMAALPHRQVSNRSNNTMQNAPKEQVLTYHSLAIALVQIAQNAKLIL